ncbi:hypothetical protein X777_08302 [Ooceraea biroi]|nr:hypothetical protein X777_08302 [Ooceraea biroi]
MKLPSTLMKSLKLLQRNFAQSRHNCDSKETWQYTLSRLAFEWSGFNRYGLYTHDVIDHTHPAVLEALRRLPEEMVDTRNFR